MSWWEDDGREGRAREISNGGGYEYAVYTVGKKYGEWATQQDGYILEYGENGFTLYCMLPNVSADERKQFSENKPIEVRYSIIADICFFCFKFGDMPWADCPFSPAIYKDAGRVVHFPMLHENEGYSLTVLLIDSATGELLYIRLIGMEHEFSAKWTEWAASVANVPMSREEYSGRVDEIYKSYTTQEVVLQAESFFLIGSDL